MSESEEVEFSMKVMINEERTKVLFAETNSHFADILLSFLTLPLGRIVGILEKHYGDEAPTIGSLSSLHNSLANLDSSHFWTEGAKQTLLSPISSFQFEYERLKLDISDSHPADFFYCSSCFNVGFQIQSMYYDNVSSCRACGHKSMKKGVAEKGAGGSSGGGVFTRRTSSFIISDDLRILPSETGLLGVISTLCITDMDTATAEPIKVTFGLSEIMNLLKASLISPTPLSDLILNKTREGYSVTVEPEPQASLNQVEDDPESKKMILKVMIQKSTGRLLYVQAKEDFVEFLFSLLCIPLGRIEHLLAGKTCIKAINNLYRSTTEFIDSEYFKSPDMKNRLMKLNLAHGCVSENHILPLTEEPLPAVDFSEEQLWRFSSDRFPKGQGSYIEGPRTYKVTDDLTVMPFCIVSALSTLKSMKVPISDVKEVEMQIGPKEAMNIFKASLTSTSALTRALLNPPSIKQPKPEPQLYSY